MQGDMVIVYQKIHALAHKFPHMHNHSYNLENLIDMKNMILQPRYEARINIVYYEARWLKMWCFYFRLPEFLLPSVISDNYSASSITADLLSHFTLFSPCTSFIILCLLPFTWSQISPFDCRFPSPFSAFQVVIISTRNSSDKRTITWNIDPILLPSDAAYLAPADYIR